MLCSVPVRIPAMLATTGCSSNSLWTSRSPHTFSAAVSLSGDEGTQQRDGSPRGVGEASEVSEAKKGRVDATTTTTTTIGAVAALCVCVDAVLISGWCCVGYKGAAAAAVGAGGAVLHPLIPAGPLANLASTGGKAGVV